MSIGVRMAIMPPLPVKVALYKHQLDVAAQKSITLPWEDFANLLVETGEESPCTVANGPDRCVGKKCPHKSYPRTAKGFMVVLPVEIDGPREDRYVKSMSALALDFDHITRADVSRVIEKLAPYEFAAYTTHNNRTIVRLPDGVSALPAKDDVCIRFVVALSRPVDANQWHRFLPVAIKFLGVEIEQQAANGKRIMQPDPTCKNRSRPYYMQTWPKDAPHDAWRNRGTALPVDVVLEWGDRFVPNVEPPLVDDEGEGAPIIEGSGWDLSSEPVQDLIEAIERYLPDHRRHELAMAIAGALRRVGATKEDARRIIFEGFKRGGSDDPKTRANVVDHTWALAPDAMMTGYSRMLEILPEEDAAEIGEKISLCALEEVLAPLHERYRAGDRSAEIVELVAPSLPATAIDLNVIRKSIRDYATKKAHQNERLSQVQATILRRALDGKLLARPDGVNDPETRLDESDNGLAIPSAINRLGTLLANAVPITTPWHAVREIVRDSVAQLADPPAGQTWLARAEAAFKAGLAERKHATATRINEGSQTREKIRQSFTGGEPAEVEGRDASPPPPLPFPPLAPPPPLPVEATLGPGVPISQSVIPIESARTRTPSRGSTEPPDGPNWRDLLVKGPNGAFQQIAHNAKLFLRNHEDLRGCFRWNEVTKEVEVSGALFNNVAKFGLEQVISVVEDYLSAVHQLRVPYRDLKVRVVGIARQNSYDPIKEHLEALRWDGVPRLDAWLKEYCGAVTDNNEAYLSLVGRRWMISLVARALDPGCKVHTVLVLEGDGGLGKSSIFEIIGGEWFCDTPLQLGDKDSRMMAARYWLCELAELVAFKKTDQNVLKNFFSSRVDHFRPPFKETLEESPRRCVFVSTTNEDDYLVDETGNRRYLPVKCLYTKEALDRLRRDRNQLLAEAVAYYRAGEKWHFDYEEKHITEAETEKRMVETPINVKVPQWWYGLAPKDRPAAPTVVDVFEQAVDMNRPPTDGDLKKIGHALAKMRFVKRRDSTPPRLWRWWATEELLNAPQVGKRKTSLFSVPSANTKQDEKK